MTPNRSQLTRSCDPAAGHLRLVIVDDHLVVRAGLLSLLGIEPGFEIVGEAATGDEAVELAIALKPDVMLMDLVLPGGISGIEATARIAELAPSVRVLVLTTYDFAEDVVRAIEAGAAGYLLKEIPHRELVAAVRTTASGETVLAPTAAQALLQRTRTPPARPVLSPRESEVLGLVAEGLSNPEIATRLYITEATVKTHLVRTFAKLKVDDRTAAVVVALGRGLLVH